MSNKREILQVETKTTKDLLQLISGKFGIGGVMTEALQFKDESAESEAKAELERRIGIIFNESHILETCGFKFGNFMRHATADIFTVEVFVGNTVGHDEQFLQGVLGELFSVNSVTPAGSYSYLVSFDIKNFENRLVQNEEPAGIYVNEAPLIVDQITRPRLHWANLQFDKAVQPYVNGTSTAFKRIDEVDGELRIYAETAFRLGNDVVFQYVSGNKPLGFYVNWGDKVPVDGFYLRISFEDFKKLLPSTVVDEERAGVSGKVKGAIG